MSGGRIRAMRGTGLATLLGGNFLSTTGSMVHVAVTSWLVFRLTGSSAMVGAMQAARAVPMALLTVPGGAVVDHLDRRRFITLLELASTLLAVSLAWLVWGGYGTAWTLVAVMSAFGAMGAFEGPAWISLVGSVLPAEHMLLGYSLNSVSFHLGATVGPPLGTLLLSVAGPGWAFFANGVSYLAIVFAVRRLPPEHRPPAPFEGVRRAVGDAFAFARRSPRARRLLPMSSALSLVVFSLPSLLPTFASEQLHGGSATFGVLMGAFGGGNFVGALELGLLSSRATPGTIMTIGVSASAAGVCMLAVAPSVGVAIAAMVLVGAGQLSALVTARTVLMQEAGPVLGGRVVGLFMMLTIGLAPLGGLALGFASDAFGVVVALRSAAVFACVVAAAVVLGRHAPR